MIVLAPTSLIAQSSGRALLRSDRGTLLNGNPAPDTSAIFSDDFIQTQEAHTAMIDGDGYTVLIQPETIVQFEGDELVLDHGGLQVNTMREVRVRVNCVTVLPLKPDQTNYDVTDVDGKINVVAHKNDVRIRYKAAVTQKSKQTEHSDIIVHEGEQFTREDRCGAAVNPADVVEAKGALLNSMWAKAAALITVGTITCFSLCSSDVPVSPAIP